MSLRDTFGLSLGRTTSVYGDTDTQCKKETISGERQTVTDNCPIFIEQVRQQRKGRECMKWTSGTRGTVETTKRQRKCNA